MENKFEKSFSDEPYAKLLFSTNQVPISLDDTTAFFSRWNLIVCNNAFTGEKCNPHILKEITTKEELSGLLNWALDGLDRLLKNGKFSTNDNIEDLRSEYIRKSNSAKAFIEENLEYDPDKNAIIIEIDLYEKYILYCKANKLPTMPKRNFTMNIQENLPQAKQTIERILGKNTHVWQYLKTATSATPAIIYGDKSNTSPEKGDQPEVAEVANSENVPISQTPLNPRLNKPEVAEVANSKESLLEVCKFCGKPIAGNIHDWIGENLDDPAHLECAEKWRELREIKP